MAFGSQITLHSLPPELLAHVVVHIENARTLFHLALTCKRMNSFIEDEGFRVFVQTRFPYLRPPPNSTCSFWKDATHGLTTLSRNWERKAFVAYTINPRSEVSDDVGRNKARAPPRQRGQTMGFVPVIDSYETWYGGEWSSRKEIVAWGAGAELIMRSKVMGDRSKNATEFPENSYMKGINSHQHNYSWTSYSENGAVDGRDDITCVNLLPQQSLVDLEQVIIGRASGGLAHLSLSPETCRSSLLAWYRTDERPVRSTAILEGSNPLLAACLSDSVVALYSISPKAGQIPPIGQLSATSSGKSRTWCSRFVSTHRLAVGFGTSRRPIHVYNIGRGELSAENLDTIGFDDSDIDGQLDMQSIENPTATSVYSLAPVAACSSAGTARGDTFMSGAYDGLAR